MTNDLIFVSLEPWDDIWRRNQFVCAELARRHPRMKILFVAPARDLSNAVRRRDFRDFRSGAPTTVPGFANIFLTRGTKVLPNSFAVGRVFNEGQLRRHVRSVADRLGMRQPLLWLNAHSAVHMVGRMGEQGVIYDITDDWTSFQQAASHIELIKRQDRELCDKADVVIVCSERLREMKASQPGVSEKLHLIANGVDAAHYAGIGTSMLAVAEQAKGWPKPVYGYTGTIHADRVDLGLVDALAGGIGSGSIVLVGPSHLLPHEAEHLKRRGNMFLTGPVPYREIPSYMQAFDVCITPHRMTAFTESLNPIKLWEYLAAGKPIVSTDVAGFREYPQHVRIARDAEGFVKALREALAEDAGAALARKREAAGHSWKERVDRIEELFTRLGAVKEDVERGAGTRAPV